MIKEKMPISGCWLVTGIIDKESINIVVLTEYDADKVIDIYNKLKLALDVIYIAEINKPLNLN